MSNNFQFTASHFNQIMGSLTTMQGDIAGLKAGQARLEKEMKLVKKDIKKIKTDLNLVIDVFDRQHIKASSRLDRIETNLGLPSLF